MNNEGDLPGMDAFRNSAPRFANRAVSGLREEFRAIPELAERGRRRLDIFFDRLNRCLTDVEFIGGGSFSMADITGVVAVDSAGRSKKFIPEDHEHARRWYRAMYERESVKSTYVEAWTTLPLQSSLDRNGA